MNISVVVPTFERPDRVVVAVRSALLQSRPPLEVIVVVDGTGDFVRRTLDALDTLGDSRVRGVAAGARLGNAGARNLGVTHARGDWIALLDDDDVWAREKLARQCAALAHVAEGTPDVAPGAAPRAARGVPIASCRLNAVAGERRFRWPRLLPRPEESVAHYLFCRRWPVTGDRILQTSTLLAPRALFVEVPFRRGRRFIDQDWLLRCDHERGVRLLFPADREPLVDWDIARTRRRVSHYRNWRWCIAWTRRRRHLLDRRANAAFLLTLASASAADAGEFEAFVPLLREAWREGRPNPAELITHVANFLFSRTLRDRLATGFNRLLRS